MKKKVILGMSGGVDSAVAALLLKDMGYEVEGVTLRLLDGNEKGEADAASVADRLGIEHTVVDFRADFERDVVADFIKVYEEGGTPNPCVACNRCIKFPLLLRLADERGAEYAATGHFARLSSYEGSPCIVRAADLAKDQSYVLYPLARDMLSRILLPLGDYTKAEVRALAHENGFVNASKSESQDICFVPDGDYASFIERYTGKCFSQGDFLDSEGSVLGKHGGAIRYTVGQRKGLGIALGERAFVLSKDMEKNTVTLGKNEALFSSVLTACRVNWHIDEPKVSLRLSAKIRYNQPVAQGAEITPLAGGRICVKFDTPQRAISAGQSLVMYDGDRLVGGGIIE